MPERDLEKWVLSDQELSPDQARIVEEAMKGSEELRSLALSWTQVEQILQSAGEIKAPAGFTQRWQEQIAVRDEKARIRQLKWFLIIALGLVSLTLLLFALLIFNLVASPAEIMVTGLRSILLIRSTVEVGYSFLSATLELVPAFIWVPISFLTSAMIVGIVVTWIVSLYRFAYIGVRNGV
jgi:hypothetical protein